MKRSSADVRPHARANRHESRAARVDAFHPQMTLTSTPRVGGARRHRGRQLALLASVIVLGLASRRHADAIPPYIARYAGDTLWATAAYLALGLAWPRARVRSLAVGAALISLAVELSQLAQPG